MSLFLFIIPFTVFFVGFFAGSFLGAIPYYYYLFLNYFVLLFLICFFFFEFFTNGSWLFYNVYFFHPTSWFGFDFVFLYDFISLSMTFLVILITTLVIIYTVGYMSEDPYRLLYSSYLSFFCFAMLFLILGGSFLILFFGWELVGFASFLLISFKTTSINSGKSALLAVISNKIGDVMLLFSALMLYYFFSTLDYYSIFLIFSELNFDIILFSYSLSLIDFICFFIALACFAKSAQAFFFVWLINSMCSPTPTSSLLHSSTMVLAGVYLFIRIAPILDFAPYTRLFIMLVGSLSMVFGSIFAMFQMDIKKIIAFSTISQIGFIIMVVSVSLYNYAFFHLICHGFVKNLIFLVAGFLIHSLSGLQDIRYYGSLSRVFPFASFCIIISAFSLIGFPFTTVFYSKDAILDVLYFRIAEPQVVFVFVFSLIGVILTTLYSSKLLYYIFFAPLNTPRVVLDLVHYPSSVMMYLPIFFLSFASVVFGYFLKEFYLGFYVFNYFSILGSQNLQLFNFSSEYYVPFDFKIFVYLIISFTQFLLFKFYSSSYFFVYRFSLFFNFFRTFFGYIFYQNTFTSIFFSYCFFIFFYFFYSKLLDPFSYFPALIRSSFSLFEGFSNRYSIQFFYYNLRFIFSSFMGFFIFLLFLIGVI
jgi:NADH:ubiquinone oxidoreductase subunit 5 (subunit L)/multisubunit Na+/H+ antiporter MnhA subunit